jgi:hypothetical protein
MILEEETFEAFGYYPSKLTYGSNKRMLVACDDCGEIRETSKHAYHALCKSCALKGKIPWNLGIRATKESKALMSVAHTGKKRKAFTEEAKANMGTAQKGKFGENARAWNGGRKVSRARSRAKRRELGHTLIYPVEEGEHGHHFTDEYVGGIPEDVHNSIGGRRKKHRTRVLQWLKANDKRKYKRVLCILAKEPL